MKLYVITALVLVVAVEYANAGLFGNFGRLGRFGKNTVQGRQADKSYGFEGAVRLPYIPEYMVKVQRTMRGKTQSEKAASPAQSSAEERRYRVTERQEAEEEEAQEAEEPQIWEDELNENERNIFHRTNPKFRRVRRSSSEERQEEAEGEEGAAEEAGERGFLRRGKREDESLSPGFTFLIRGKRTVSKTPKKYSEHPFVAGAGAVDTESEERSEEAEEDQERKYSVGGYRSPYYIPPTEREYNNFGSGIRYRNEERTPLRRRGSASQSRQEEGEEWIDEHGEEAAEEQQEEAAEEQQEEAAEEQQEEAAEETGEAPISQQRPAASPQRRRMRRLRSRLGAASSARRRLQSPASAEDARRDFLPDLTLPFNSKHGAPLRDSVREERLFFDQGASAGVNQRFPLTDHKRYSV